MPVDVVVFDLDDTLYAEHDYVKSGFQAVSRWLEDTHGTPGFFDASWELFTSGRRGKVFDEALAALKCDASSERVGECVRVYREHDPAITLFEDAVWALDHVRGRWRTALLTDGWLGVQQRKVAALGLAPRFELLVYSDAFGREHWKPDALPYETVTRTLPVTPERCLYVADNPAKDFVTARKLGWRTARVARAGGEYNAPAKDASWDAERVVDDLRALEAILAR